MRLFVAALCVAAFAQVKPLPPPGVAIPDADRAALIAHLEQLREKFTTQPDLAVRWKAVDWALRYNGFFKPEEVAKAKAILDEKFGEPGLFVHGYKSDIDDSVQPYGIVLPPSYSRNAKGKWRLDVWLHGRGDTTTELNFIHDRLTKRGEFTPPDTIVLHPFGRFCNAFKFAGETDVFEAIADAKRRYRIDDNHISIRGFSMGGAGTWHLAAHHPGFWAAAAPGAGFVDTEEYQKLREKNQMPEPWVQKLWLMTNAKDYALNFFNLPVIAYSGEDDPQKAAADIMSREMAKRSISLAHVIGPKTGHKYEPTAKEALIAHFEPLMEHGRRLQNYVRFETYTLRYNRSHWVIIEGLEEHWKRTFVEAVIKDDGIEVKTSNVTRLTFDFGPGEAPFQAGQSLKVTWGTRVFRVPPPRTDGSWRWTSDDPQPAKRPGLQGPIDDAFFSRFIMVKPADSAPAWVKSEFDHAVREWRNIFRGDAIVKTETELTPDDLARANLVLWGTPSTSTLMKKWPAPIDWPSEPNQSLIAIYPNPEHTGRYIVLNSGSTFREAHHATNSQQTPKLPDWAIVDTSVAPDANRPGRIVDAGFFDEQWRFPRRTLQLKR